MEGEGLLERKFYTYTIMRIINYVRIGMEKQGCGAAVEEDVDQWKISG